MFAEIDGITCSFQVAAISEQASESATEPSTSEENSSNAKSWKSFDMRAVVASTEDLLQFILSEKGLRVRIFILRDIIKAADAFLQDEVVGRMLNEKLEATGKSDSEVSLLTSLYGSGSILSNSKVRFLESCLFVVSRLNMYL